MKTKPQPRLYTHRTVAKLLGISTETLRAWVAAGEFPKPLAKIQRTWLYESAAIDHWVKTGIWPEGTRFNGNVGRRSEGRK